MTDQEYRQRYSEQLVKRGLDADFAKQIAAEAEVDWGTPPEQAADDCLSYMMEDSE